MSVIVLLHYGNVVEIPGIHGGIHAVVVVMQHYSLYATPSEPQLAKGFLP